MPDIERIAAGFSEERAARIEKDQNFAIDVLHDRIQWSIWADADRKDVSEAVDAMNEGTCWDSDVVALVVVPRGITNQDAQQAVDTVFRAHLTNGGQDG